RREAKRPGTLVKHDEIVATPMHLDEGRPHARLIGALGGDAREARPGALPLDPAKGGALRTPVGLLKRGGRLRRFNHLVGHPSSTNQSRIPKAPPLAGIEPRSGSMGAEPLAFLP